uniref:Uncharacterized protein n=1 Tax=Moniliophthora roreri TaxID=221103 RepID=A0A0W0G110_MONRR
MPPAEFSTTIHFLSTTKKWNDKQHQFAFRSLRLFLLLIGLVASTSFLPSELLPLLQFEADSTNSLLSFTFIAMFAKIAATLISLSVLATGVVAAPLDQSLARRTSHGFSGWHGISSLDHFDDFYGIDNFSGSIVEQKVVVQKEELVCHTQAIEIIQQRLVVLQEMAKKIITETICEVETQTIVFEQFVASTGHFRDDLFRVSGRRPGYDSSIVSHFGDLQSADGSISTHDLGFSGKDVGTNTVVVGGSNWNDETSPESVGAAFGATQDAVNSSSD